MTPNRDVIPYGGGGALGLLPVRRRAAQFRLPLDREVALPRRRESRVWPSALLMAPAQGRPASSCMRGLRARPLLWLLTPMPQLLRPSRAQKVCGERSA